MSEAHLSRAIQTYIRSLSDAKVIKIHGNTFIEKGTPDLIACIQGKMFLFEIKIGNYKLSKIQKVRLKEWREAGAVARVVRSVKEVEGYIKQELDKNA